MITLTVPEDNERALRAAAQFFQTMCGDETEVQYTVSPMSTVMPEQVVGRAQRDETAAPEPHGWTPQQDDPVEPATTVTFDEGLSTPTDRKAPDNNVVPPATETPAPPEPPAAPEPPPAPAAEEELDAEGMPFDSRIHSKSKVKNKKDNCWRRRKNISDEYYNQVVAQIKGTQPGPPTPESAPPPTGEEVSFAYFVNQVAQKINRQEISQPEVDAAVTKYGLSQFADFQNHPEIMNTYAQEIGII